MTRHFMALALLSLLASPLFAAEAAKPDAKDDLSPADQIAAAKAVAPSLVRVEYTLQFDQGDPPRINGWGQRCPNCGGFHGINAQEFVEEERPVEFAGYVLGPTRVMTADINVHPRFIKKIEVRSGDQVIAAKPVAWAVEQDAVFLELEKPLKDAKPLQFDATRKPPYLSVSYDRLNGAWTTNVDPASMKVAVPVDEPPFIMLPSNSVVVDKTGMALAIPMRGDAPLDDAWKGSPAQWPTVGEAEMKKMLADLEGWAGQGLAQVTLKFRSPKKNAGHTSRFSGEDEEQATELHGVGVLVEDKKILVLVNLRPKVTARLEQILVKPAAGEAVAATFAGTLADYGALVATLQKPLPGAVKLAAGEIRPLRRTLLLGADVYVQGEKRIAYFQHRRISGFEIGWRGALKPVVAGEENRLFVFTRDGALAAVPLAHREKAPAGERDWRSEKADLMPVAALRTVLGDLAKNLDKNNVPLSEEEENRLAWTGVELQPLDPELAKANNVSDLTNEGRTGALVSYVYPDSPAGKAGIEVGTVVLRIHVEGQPKPIDVRVEEDRFAEGGFPWERLDELPEQYYDRIPQPWPAAENAVSRTLTDIGFGKKFTVDFFRDGKQFSKEFEVTPSPAHYHSAPRYKAEGLGLTVRDLTYEVRRYFQKKPDEPGVVVAKIEPGSKASVSGIKPYEIITHVNDKAVMNVKDFEKLVANQTELRLSIKRMAQGRVVKINMAAVDKKPPAAEKKPAKAPDGDDNPLIP